MAVRISKLESNLARRREIAAKYNETPCSVSGITLPSVQDHVLPAWHLYPVRLDLASLPAGRAEIFQALRAENIGVNVHYIPVHLHPYYRDRFGYKPGDYLVAESAYERLISLPMFHGMTDQDVDDVLCALEKVMASIEIKRRH